MDRVLASYFRAAEMGFVVLALFLFSAALVPLLVLRGGQSLSDLREGNMVLRGMFMALQATAMLLCLSRWQSFVRAAFVHPATLVLVGLALLSVVWSDAPDVTLRRSIALVGTTAVGVYLAARYPLRTILHLLAAALGIAAVLSVAFALLLPRYGVSAGAHAGAWQGIYTHKNVLAQMMVLSAFTGLLVWRGAASGRWLLLGSGMLSVLLVILSTSTSSLIVLAGLGALLPLYTSLRWTAKPLVVALCFATVLGTAALVLALAHSETVVGAFGKDLTLTGRTALWQATLGVAWERPWLGFGYSAFWVGTSGAAQRIFDAVGFEIPLAHNGYLDLLLNLGVLGLATFLAGFALAVSRAAALARRSHGWEELWPLLFFTFLLLSNLTESNILYQNSLIWVLYVATVCSSGMRRLPKGSGAPAPESGRHSPHPAAAAALSPGVRRRYRHLTTLDARGLPTDG